MLWRTNTQSNRPGRTPFSGFTLIELIVVVGIVAILVALISPALMAGIHASRQAACSSNLRQIAAELQSYAADHNGVTIPVDNGSGSWGNILAQWDGSVSYLKAGKNGSSFSFWRCPENMLQTMGNTNSAYHGLSAKEYGCSYTLNGFAQTTTNGPGLENSYSYNYMGNFTHPSQLYMVFDGFSARADPTKDTGNGSVPTNMYTSGIEQVRYEHTGRINMVFADGHGEILTGPLVGEGTRLIPGGPNAANTFSNGIHWFAH